MTRLKKNVWKAISAQKELILLGIIAVGSTVSWLWLIRLHDLHDALIVLLGGLSGISATLCVMGLVSRFYKKGDK